MYQAPKLCVRIWGVSERSTRIYFTDSDTQTLYHNVSTKTSHILLLHTLQAPRRKCLDVLSACLTDDIELLEQLLCQKQWGESEGRSSGPVEDILGHCWDFHKTYLENGKVKKSWRRLQCILFISLLRREWRWPWIFGCLLQHNNQKLRTS